MNSFIFFCIFISIIGSLFSCIFFFFCIPSYTSLVFINFFLLKKSYISSDLNFELPTQCAGLLLSLKQLFFEDTQDGFFLSSRLIGFTHSSLFQCIWNFKSFQYWLASLRFLFISYSFFWYFLLSFLFLLDWVLLGSLTGILWNNYSI